MKDENLEEMEVSLTLGGAGEVGFSSLSLITGEIAEISKGKPLLITDACAVTSVSYLAYDLGVRLVVLPS